MSIYIRIVSKSIFFPHCVRPSHRQHARIGLFGLAIYYLKHNNITKQDHRNFSNKIKCTELNQKRSKQVQITSHMVMWINAACDGIGSMKWVDIDKKVKNIGRD